MSPTDVQPRGRLADHALAALGFLACLGLAATIWRLGPQGLIPTHFSIQGKVDRWSDRTHAAMFVAGFTALLALCYAALGLLTGSARRNLRAARLIIVLVALMTAAILTAGAFGVLSGPGAGPSRLQPAVLSVLFLVVGALIGKASPNPMVGVRTYWSLRSRLAWDKSNRLCGRLLFAVGALGLIASVIAPPMQVMVAVIVAVLLSAAAAVVESWRVWRTDPERQPG